jgi:hypothetical protein
MTAQQRGGHEEVVCVLGRYNLYNKPWVLSQWFKEARPKQDFFLVLDADMVIRRPFLPEEHGVRQGGRRHLRMHQQG